MSVTRLDAFLPLSSVWTYEMLMSQVMSITGVRDSENVQTMEIRAYINQALTHIAEVMKVSGSPWYGAVWSAVTETPSFLGEVEYIDLSNDFRAMNNLERLIIHASMDIDDPPNRWRGAAARVDIKEIFALHSGRNRGYRQSICWAQHGSKIYLFIGDDIKKLTEDGTFNYHLSEWYMYLWGYRRPMLDSLKARNDPQQNFTDYIDLPDKYINSLILLTEKLVMKQLGELHPNQYVNEVEKVIAELKQTMSEEEQFEQREEEKKKVNIPPDSEGAFT